MKNQLYFGAAYYPELWNDKVIEEDIRYMKQAGINVVRMGEFAWADMEPSEDRIDLDFFVKIINKLDENGIETIFCTPTATPPIWISHLHPERMHVDENGTIMSHGARQHVCTNNPYFRKRSSIIVESIAEAIGKLPGVIAWQIDNELKCHVAECLCQSCKEQWHQWLEDRYRQIDRLNEAWGTGAWSQKYQSFDQVPQPIRTTFVHNASLTTMYRIFTQEKTAQFLEEQVSILRKYSSMPITHNTNRWFEIDNERLFRNLDFAAYDDYPHCDDYHEMLMNNDFYRTIKKGKPFWIMETSTSHNGYLHEYINTHRNGFLTVEALSAFAQGAQGFSFWLWRQQRTGCEQIHGSVLSAWGKPSVGYANVVNALQSVRQLENILNSTRVRQAEFALTYSDRARSFLKTEPIGLNPYKTMMDKLYKIVLNTGVHRDVIHEEADLSGYKMLWTPYVPYLSKEYQSKAMDMVENGGIWIVGPLTGWRTSEHTVHTDAALSELEEIAGVEVVHMYPMGRTGAVGRAFGQDAPLSQMSTVFRTKDAEVMGTVCGGVTPDLAFLTERKAGKGKVVMLGSMPEGSEGDCMLQAMLLHYMQEAGIRAEAEVSSGTIAIPREDDVCTFWFILNMDGNGGTVSIPDRATDVVSGESILPGNLSIGNYEYRVIQFSSPVV